MKKLLVILFLIPSILFCQDISDLQNKKLNDLNDMELLNYWKEAQDNGYNIDQIKVLARAQGVSEVEIQEFEIRINELTASMDQEVDEKEFDVNKLTSIFGKKVENKKNISEKADSEFSSLPIFGSNFFNNDNINSAPQLNIATPSSYELGPGDEVLVSIWGASENEYSSEISRDGYIKIERIGPIYISGLTIAEAENKLVRILSKIYSGLILSNNSDFKTYLDISLINNRSIVVNVTGNVVAPDTYTISSLASILNVLYAAGGPNESGSFRNIRLIRNGKTINNIDLYSYFTNGELDPFSLRDQDIILVPNYENRVFVNGEFKNTGIFELKNNEKLSDLISFNGGVSSFGFKEKLFIKRTDGLNRKIDNVSSKNFSNFILKDGDIIEARTVTDYYTNLVSVEGAISVPGEYSITNISNVSDLINLAGGLKDFAIRERAYLFRKSNGVENEIISFNLNNSENIILKAEDRIVISSKIDLSRSKTVKIEGEVEDPNDYPFYDGMTLIDLILIANGVTLKGDLNSIEIYRSTYDETKKVPVKTFKISLNSDFSKLSEINNISLQENDLVVVRQKQGFQEKDIVTVEGLVKLPGTYAILNNNYSFLDLINDFGGFLNDASLSGVKIIRNSELSGKVLGSEILNLKDSLNTSLNISPFIEFGVDVENILKSKTAESKYNVILKSGDKIIVPKKDNTIEITGAVQQSSVINYSKSLSTGSAIGKAGGFSQNAKKNNVYVIYQNGNVANTKRFLFFSIYPKLKPGARIIVPEKNIIINKTSVAEIVGYSTSLVSIIALIKSF